jgi:DNA-binding NarL/FixJ family response regulator
VAKHCILVSVRVLVIDDSEPVRERLRVWLAESAAEEVHEAGSPERARRLLEETTFDAAILDVRLRAGNGLDLIREIRARLPRALLIVLTNDATDGHRRACLLRGADLFLDKSRQFEEAMDAVRRAKRAERSSGRFS